MVGLNTGLQLNLDKFDGERILYLKAAFGKGESKEILHHELLVVKSVETKQSALFLRFSRYVCSDRICELIRKHPNNFIRAYKFPWYDVLFYLFFRSEKMHRI